jgi:hypothetical protein
MAGPKSKANPARHHHLSDRVFILIVFRCFEIRRNPTRDAKEPNDHAPILLLSSSRIAEMMLDLAYGQAIA